MLLRVSALGLENPGFFGSTQKRGSSDAELAGGFGAVSIEFIESSSQHLGVFRVYFFHCPGSFAWIEVKVEVFGFQDVTVADHKRPLDEILKLSHVSWPVTFLKS